MNTFMKQTSGARVFAVLTIVSLLISAFPAPFYVAEASSGAIWTTKADCGLETQDENRFDIGDDVYINGAGFGAGNYNWAVTGQPGGASADPGIEVADGAESVDDTGAFCFKAYTVAADDDGTYTVDFGNKNDNYRVDGGATSVTFELEKKFSGPVPTGYTADQFTFTIEGDSFGPEVVSLTEFNDDSANGTVELPVGEYTISENGPTGFDPSEWTVQWSDIGCESQTALTTTIEIEESDLGKANVGCRADNQWRHGILTVEKEIVGTSTDYENFSFAVEHKGNNVFSGPFESDGDNQVNVGIGAYEVTEDGASGFATSYSPECSGIMEQDERVTCVITNTWNDDYVPESCSDGIQNQDETGVDAGGVCGDPTPTCDDGIQNQDETGVDIGGVCGGGSTPTCDDGIQNQDETGVDTGGVCGGGNGGDDDPDPTVCEVGTNLLGNADFEAPIVTNNAGWNIFPAGTTDLVWDVVWANTPGSAPSPANLELHGGVNDWLPSVGAQYAELDADWSGPGGGENNEDASVAISQTVTTEPGATYELSFDFSPRPRTTEANNQLQVVADDVTLATLGANGTTNTNTDWTSYSYQFVASSSQTTVTFTDVGTSNSVGTFLDNTALCFIESGDEDDNGGGSDPEPTYKVFGYVWHDENENDEWDGFEDEQNDGLVEDDLEGWTVSITNGSTTKTTVTDAAGYYEFYVPAGTWTISETVEDEWTRTFPNDDGVHVVEVIDETESEEDTASAATPSVLAFITNLVVPATAHAQTAPTTYGPFNFGNVFTGGGGSSSGGGGGGGSSTPRCDLDYEVSGADVTLTWDTVRATEVTLTENGAEILSSTDSDDFDSSLDVSITEATEFTLTASRGSRERECSVNVPFALPDGAVLGEQVSVVPAGAPNTGAGGAAPQSIPSSLMLLAVPMATRRND